MNDRQAIKLVTFLAASGIAFYIGYEVGIRRMFDAYGHVLSEEAIAYLAQLDSEQ